MKTKSMKYDQAIARNIANAKKYVNDNPDITLDQLKIKVGIRKDDASYDAPLKALVNGS